MGGFTMRLPLPHLSKDGVLELGHPLVVAGVEVAVHEEEGLLGRVEGATLERELLVRRDGEATRRVPKSTKTVGFRTHGSTGRRANCSPIFIFCDALRVPGVQEELDVDPVGAPGGGHGPRERDPRCLEAEAAEHPEADLLVRGAHHGEPAHHTVSEHVVTLRARDPPTVPT